jgi:two-component system, NarL family, response regulator LiaR
MRRRLVIADDHQLMVAAVRVALEDAADIEIVGEASSGHQLLPLVGRTSPDIVLLDLNMPGMDGLRCLELLRERHPNVKTIVLTGSDDRAAVDACFARGAVAFVQKTVDPGDLATVIRQALTGNVFYATGYAAPISPQREWGLTEREIEILRALAAGDSNKQMAEKLWLSAHTIKYHLTNIYRKLEVAGRTEAVHLAYEHGLIDPTSGTSTASASS